MKSINIRHISTNTSAYSDYTNLGVCVDEEKLKEQGLKFGFTCLVPSETVQELRQSLWDMCNYHYSKGIGKKPDDVFKKLVDLATKSKKFPITLWYHDDLSAEYCRLLAKFIGWYRQNKL
ncbi:MAG: hypothetical protein RLZZ338_1424 [Cyanobacteriota bacterium]|jgi:hypothetical protein